MIEDNLRDLSGAQRRRIRPATPSDSDLRLRVIDLASDGVLPELWAAYAPEGIDPLEFGRGTVLADEGQFSHRVAWVIEDGHAPVGACLLYTSDAADDL